MIPALLLATATFLFLGVFAVTVLAHWRTSTPYGGTKRAVADAMVRLAELKDGQRVVDIGAGDGRLLITAKRAQPGVLATGFEIALAVWIWGKLRILLSGVPVALRLRDARKVNLSHADVIYLYVGPEMMRELEGKFDRELRPGTRVISHLFRFRGKEPERVEEVQAGARMRRVFVYRW